MNAHTQSDEDVDRIAADLLLCACSARNLLLFLLLLCSCSAATT